MRDPKRIKVILKLIETYWNKHPDLRLCQLLVNVLRTPHSWMRDMFHIEDDIVIEKFKEVLEG